MPVLMSDGFMSAVVNRAAWRDGRTGSRAVDLFPRGLIALSGSLIAGSALRARLTNRAGVTGETVPRM